MKILQAIVIMFVLTVTGAQAQSPRFFRARCPDWRMASGPDRCARCGWEDRCSGAPNQKAC